MASYSEDFSMLKSMASCFHHLFFLLFILFLHSRIESSVLTCLTSSCDASPVPVQFPFRLTNWPGQGRRCSYPGFNISCDNRSRPVLTLPGSGNFSVEHIDYEAQTIRLHERCLLGRLLNFNLSGSPFRVANTPQSLTFFNCSSSVSDAISPPMMPVRCLEGQIYTVRHTPTGTVNNRSYRGCVELGTVSVSLLPGHGDSLDEGITLTWDTPDCKSCLARGGTCGLKSGSGSKIGCANVPSKGLPRSAKYGIIIGAGIPGFLCLIGFACYIGSRVAAYGQRLHSHDSSATVALALEPCAARGLDDSTIESYPKTLLGESLRLPKPGDNTCLICLSEYLSKETLRTIPECGHYFHADCIDEWLKRNSTCPICRHSPG